MDIIAKPRYNAIFWRNSVNEPWQQADLDELIYMYEQQDYCSLKYWTTVHNTKGRELYSLFICDGCDGVIATLDKEHDFAYCPHCGRRIVK